MWENDNDDDAPPSISLNVPVEPASNLDNDDSVFVDNYHLSTSGEDEDEFSLSQKIVHYLGGHVAPEHWTACKAALVFHAGAATCKLAVMTKQSKEAACLAAYNAAIDNLDPMHFSPDAIKFFRHSFKKKSEPMGPYAVYRYFSDSRRDMRATLIPLFPKDFHSMRSGKGFHDTCNDVFVVSAYRRELIATKGMTESDANKELPPQFWEYKKIPWCFSLTVKIFRRHPQLTPDVSKVLADKSNATVSRAALKRKKQCKQVGSSSCSTLASATPTTATSSKKIKADPEEVSHNNNPLVWAKVHTARAVAVQSNVVKRAGKMNELEKMLNLLDRMRPVIGDEVYNRRVSDLAANMPNPSSYNADVEVIDVDAADGRAPPALNRIIDFNSLEPGHADDADDNNSYILSSSENGKTTRNEDDSGNDKSSPE